ncbi:hypothetical protein XENTR_v10002076, partial [Xenopus tropicalis]
FFFSLLCFTEVLSEIQIVQEKSLTAIYGENIRLGCKPTGYAFTLSFLAWLKHVPGKYILYVGWINPQSKNTWFSPSFEGGKFTIITDNARSTGYLQINNVNSEDSAVYYCAR